MSNLHPLPEALQQLGQTRFADLYPGQDVEPSIVNLLSLSDFAWSCLQSQPTLKAWLLDTDELANRTTEPPLNSNELSTLDDAAAMADRKSVV